MMKDGIMVRKQRPDTWNGHKLTHARDVNNSMVQDDLELIVVGADVEALFKSKTDGEVANLCYKAIMKSKIQFSNINYRKARLYIAINMTKDYHHCGECCRGGPAVVESTQGLHPPLRMRNIGSSLGGAD